MNDIRETRLGEIRRYIEALYGSDMASLQYDRIHDILDNDYSVTIADFADVIRGTTPPIHLAERLNRAVRLGNLTEDHTLPAAPAGEVFELFYDLDETPNFDPQEDLTVIRAFKALLASETEELERAVNDPCAAVRAAAGLNPSLSAEQQAVLQRDKFQAVLYAVEPYDFETFESAIEDSLPSTQCGCQSGRAEYLEFLRQEDLFGPETTGIGGPLNATGMWSWSTLEDPFSSASERKVMHALHEILIPDEFTFSFGKLDSEIVSIRLRFAVGPIAGMIEVSNAGSDTEDDFERRKLRSIAEPLLTLEKELIDDWFEVADVVQSVWDHIPAAQVKLDLGPRQRHIRWVYRSVGFNPSEDRESAHFIEIRRGDSDFHRVHPMTIHDSHAYLTSLLRGEDPEAE